MTVAELIVRLNDFPPDSIVKFVDDNGYHISLGPSDLLTWSDNTGNYVLFQP